MTKLEAVNRILRSVGLAPVNTLEVDELPVEATQAEAFIESQLEDVLEHDWVFNTLLNQTYEPNGDNEIVIPETVTYLNLCEPLESEHRPCIKDNKLFSRIRNSHEFFSSVVADRVVYTPEWDDIPHAVLLYILKKAENDLVNTVLGDSSLVRHSENTLGEAWRDLNKYRIKVAPKPLFGIDRVLNRRNYPRGPGISSMSIGRR